MFKCPLCGQKTMENIIDPKRTTESFQVHEELHNRVKELEKEILLLRKICSKG